MSGPNMDVIKEIPGYKVILKAVLKTQIQQLVEQLASHTDEESVILTASVADGTLSHLGSDSGKFFLDDHDDIKSQFLGFCLKRHHKKKVQEEQDQQQQQLQQQQQQLAQQIRSPPWPHLGQGPGHRPRLGTPMRQSFPRHSVPRHPMSMPSKGVRHEPYPISNPQRRRSVDSGLDNSAKAASETSTNVIIKQEPDETSQQSTEDQSSPNPTNKDTPNDQQSPDNVSRDQNTAEGNSDSNASEQNASDSNVKLEAVSESEMELEITGVELGANSDPTSSQKDVWSPNMSMGYDPTSAMGNLDDMQAQPGYNCEQGPTDPECPQYPCKICGKVFITTCRLQRHLRRVHRGANKQAPIDTGSTNSERCSKCLTFQQELIPKSLHPNVRMPKGKRRCVYHSIYFNKRKETVYGCAICNIRLCKNVCHLKYHTM